MRIVVHDYAGHPFPAQFSRELARRGHKVTHAFAAGLLTPRGVLQRAVGDAPTLDFAEVPMSPQYKANKYNFLKRRGYEMAYGRQLANLLERTLPDIVISGNTPTEPQWTMIRAARRLGVPVVSWVQDFYSVAVEKLAGRKLPLAGALAGWWYRHLDGKCLRASAGVVAVTEDFVPVLAGFGVRAERVTVIPNWAPLDELPLRPRGNEWSATRGLDGKFVFLYSGTLAMKHNPDLLRRLAVRFRDDAEVRAVVISEGPGADYLRERKGVENLDNLELLPFQRFEDMPDILAAADVLVAVLEADAGVFSVPSKVLTYHCAAKPILAAIPSANLAARIIAKEGTGICVEPADVNGFLEAAAALRQNGCLRRRYGAAARAYAEDNFDIEMIADRFEDVLSRALSKREAVSA
jgi:glycosyltransferase involved in cell wall biosynthesis